MRFNEEEVKVINTALIYYAMTLSGDDLSKVRHIIDRTDAHVNSDEFDEIKEIISEY